MFFSRKDPFEFLSFTDLCLDYVCFVVFVCIYCSVEDIAPFIKICLVQSGIHKGTKIILFLDLIFHSLS